MPERGSISRAYTLRGSRSCNPAVARRKAFAFGREDNACSRCVAPHGNPRSQLYDIRTSFARVTSKIDFDSLIPRREMDFPLLFPGICMRRTSKYQFCGHTPCPIVNSCVHTYLHTCNPELCAPPVRPPLRRDLKLII